MLPEQADILWTFVTIIFTLFSLFAFINVIQHCREHKGTNTVLWGTVFGAGLIINLMLTNRMFDLTQQEQLGFISYQVLAIFLTLIIFCPKQKRSVTNLPIFHLAADRTFVWVIVLGHLKGCSA